MSHGKILFLSIIVIGNIFRTYSEGKACNLFTFKEQLIVWMKSASDFWPSSTGRQVLEESMEGNRTCWQCRLSSASSSLEHRGLLAKWQERHIGPATITQPHAVHWSFSGDKATPLREREVMKNGINGKQMTMIEISRQDWQDALGIHGTKSINCNYNNKLWHTWSIDILNVKCYGLCRHRSNTKYDTVVLKHVSVHK